MGYALTQDNMDPDNLNHGGTLLGLRGLLRDSDPFVGPDTETIEVNVTKDSNIVTSVVKGAFRRRTGLDVIREGDVKQSFGVRPRDSDDQLTRTSKWTGATGKRTFTFSYDMYNYAVHFSMPVE